MKTLLPATCPRPITPSVNREGVKLVANDLLDAFAHVKLIERIDPRDRDNLEALAELVIHRIRTVREVGR
ncbi:MAG TPA: hypothetical protein PKC67_02480 [Kiritimatiellia bacterium]|nr:hypothetical protein [Kiritimatiellia bacterium]HMP33192.1 hypothetical protein [Kiritimatiellia bacterium]